MKLTTKINVLFTLKLNEKELSFCRYVRLNNIFLTDSMKYFSVNLFFISKTKIVEKCFINFFNKYLILTVYLISINGQVYGPANLNFALSPSSDPQPALEGYQFQFSVRNLMQLVK